MNASDPKAIIDRIVRIARPLFRGETLATQDLRAALCQVAAEMGAQPAEDPRQTKLFPEEQ